MMTYTYHQKPRESRTVATGERGKHTQLWYVPTGAVDGLETRNVGGGGHCVYGIQGRRPWPLRLLLCCWWWCCWLLAWEGASPPHVNPQDTCQPPQLPVMQSATHHVNQTWRSMHNPLHCRRRHGPPTEKHSTTTHSGFLTLARPYKMWNQGAGLLVSLVSLMRV
jgi:hypothetical protein